MRLLKLGMLIVCMFSAVTVFAETAVPPQNSGNTNMNLAANVPPGLQKKGVTSAPFGNTPPGWSRGVKKGWNKDKDWHWDNKTKLWENKHWRWDSSKGAWIKSK